LLITKTPQTIGQRWYLKNNNMRLRQAQCTDNEVVIVFKVAWIGYKMATIVRHLALQIN